ncbi:hypothetical protein QAD02_000310 [Eretmocerus hayati]|uniref:Uncharacterized protein n=1 Tax=Eretmocerus hayati TaxID=131215 RepID=A0ACC2ND92_9HYME|nr:hypothetical protein QAD02_000310 [Eretmocerus hayati]
MLVLIISGFNWSEEQLSNKRTRKDMETEDTSSLDEHPKRKERERKTAYSGEKTYPNEQEKELTPKSEGRGNLKKRISALFGRKSSQNSPDSVPNAALHILNEVLSRRGARERGKSFGSSSNESDKKLNELHRSESIIPGTELPRNIFESPVKMLPDGNSTPKNSVHGKTAPHPVDKQPSFILNL